MNVTLALSSLRVFLNGLDYFNNSNYHKIKDRKKQLSQRAQLCCILLGLCASTAVTKVFETICVFSISVCFVFSLLLRFNIMRTYSHYDIRAFDRVAPFTRIRSYGMRQLMVVSFCVLCLWLLKWEHLSILCRNTKALRGQLFAHIEDETWFLYFLFFSFFFLFARATTTMTDIACAKETKISSIITDMVIGGHSDGLWDGFLK